MAEISSARSQTPDQALPQVLGAVNAQDQQQIFGRQRAHPEQLAPGLTGRHRLPGAQRFGIQFIGWGRRGLCRHALCRHAGQFEPLQAGRDGLEVEVKGQAGRGDGPVQFDGKAARRQQRAQRRRGGAMEIEDRVNAQRYLGLAGRERDFGRPSGLVSAGARARRASARATSMVEVSAGTHHRVAIGRQRQRGAFEVRPPARPPFRAGGETRASSCLRGVGVHRHAHEKSLNFLGDLSGHVLPGAPR